MLKIHGKAVLAIAIALAVGSPSAQADHWSTGVPTHAEGPVTMPGSDAGLLGRMAIGTRRVLGTGVRIVHTGVTLPFKLGAAAVRSFSSDGESATASSRSRARSKTDNSLSQSSDGGEVLTISEWMRQPRPQ